MSNLNWDWWFGDEPLLRRPVARRPLVACPKQWLRSKRLRRWLLSVAVLGTQGELITGIVSADSPTRPVAIAPISFGWASSASTSLLIAQGNQEAASGQTEAASDQTEAAVQDQNRQERLSELLEGNQSSDDEDARRRQRLKDLLDGGMEEDLPPPGTADDQQPADPSDEMRSKEDGDDSDGKDLFAQPFIEERLPEVAGGRFVLPPLRAVSIDQAPIGNGKIPESLEAGEELTLAPLPEDAYARSRLTNSAAWPSLIRPWAAPNTFSHPLYFEDRMLERHGHERWGCWQPIASGARFFATVPMLPYLTTIQEPCDMVYSKGYYRAGSPTPRLYQRPPLERRAVMVEAASIAGGFIALP